MKRKQAKRMPDFPLILIVGTLLGISIISIFSASSIVSLRDHGTSYYYVKRQMFFIVISTLALLIAMHFNYHTLKKIAIPIISIISISLIAVLIPTIGVTISGARRWIRIAGFNVQPSEYAKLALVIFIAWDLSRRQDVIKDLAEGFLKPLMVPAGISCLILIQPDMGTTIDILLITFIMLYVAGTKIKYIVTTVVLSSPVALLLIKMYPYRLKRFKAFLDPWKDPQRSGYQILQSWNAMGSGGIAGKGLGESTLKLGYLPAPHTDFIFAIIGEEVGFIGTITVLTLFILLTYRGIKIACDSPDNFGKLLAFGIISMVAIQAFINISVATGTMPTTGIPLPFISYGGSSLMINMIGMGILLNISRQN